MSQSRRLVAVMATLATLVAVPATASASTNSVAPTKASVQANVDKATTAVKRIKRYARLGDAKQVASQLKIARSQTAAASKGARRMANAADTQSENLKAAQALTLAGTQYDDLVEAITAIVDQITGQVQALVANSIAPSLAGKQKIIDVLNQILPQVPAAAQPIIATVIAALSAGDADEVMNLNDALQTGGLPVNVSAIVSQALAMATGLIDQAFGMIQGLVPMLPAVIQGPLAQVLNMVNSVVGTIVPTVLTTVTGLIDTILGSLPFVGGTSAGAGGAFGLGGLLDGILGGGSADLGGIGGLLDGLLGGLFGGGSGGSTPAAGVGGILSTVTGLVNNLLGGLLGGGGLVPST
jgi:uncharacterized protein YqgV (UPF0045/DUF77 family)